MKITETCILEDRGIIYIEGPDTKEFLQNIITNNLDKISDKQSIYSSLLTPQGKYLFDFILVKHKKGYLIDCEKIELENLIKVKVWERGVGITKACGTAACATAVAGYKKELTQNIVDIQFELGAITISIDKNNSVNMKGKVSEIKEIDIKI